MAEALTILQCWATTTTPSPKFRWNLRPLTVSGVAHTLVAVIALPLTLTATASQTVGSVCGIRWDVRSTMRSFIFQRDLFRVFIARRRVLSDSGRWSEGVVQTFEPRHDSIMFPAPKKLAKKSFKKSQTGWQGPVLRWLNAFSHTHEKEKI